MLTPHPEKDSFLSALPAMAITTPEAEVGPLQVEFSLVTLSRKPR